MRPQGPARAGTVSPLPLVSVRPRSEPKQVSSLAYDSPSYSRAYTLRVADGSITLPCLQSCLYGLKPTVGMLSRSGVVPFAPYFDTPGPMAKDVESLAILMDVMQGRDDEDDKSEFRIENAHRVRRLSLTGL